MAGLANRSQSVMLCCGTKAPKSFQQSRMQLEHNAGRKWRFGDDELLEFTKRFKQYAVNQKISHKNYRESLGIIGIESLSFMCDRMFNIMDKDKDGFITLSEYLNYVDVLLYGSEEEKLKQSFELLDVDERGKIYFIEFKKIVSSFAQMWSAALGQPTPINPRVIETIFYSLAQHKDHFDINDFIREMKENPNMLQWLWKPERAMQKRMNDYMGQHEQRQQLMRERIEGLQLKFDQYQVDLQGKLQEVIEIITGVVTPDRSLNNIVAAPEPNSGIFNYHSRTSSQSLNTQQNNNTPKGNAAQFGDMTGKRMLKKVKTTKYVSKLSKSHKDLAPLAGAGGATAQGNNLFLSINTLALEQIDFPNKIFDNALSPKYHNATYHHGSQIINANRKNNNHGHHHSNSFLKGTLRKQTHQQSSIPNTIDAMQETLARKSAGHILSTAKQDDIQQNDILFKSTTKQQLDEMTPSGEKFMQLNSSHSNKQMLASSGGVSGTNQKKKKSLQKANIVNNFMINEESDQSAKIKRYDGSAEHHEYIEEDQNALNFYASAISKASAQSNQQIPRHLRSSKYGGQKIIEDDEAMQFEGGSKESLDEEFKEGSGRHQPSLGETEQNDGILNENDVRIALRDLAESENVQMTPLNQLPPIQSGSNTQPHHQNRNSDQMNLQANPMYPGQFYFINSPSQLHQNRGKTAQVQAGHQIVEVDGESADCSSYLSSNSDQENENLVKKPSMRFGGTNEFSDEEIDVEKLDQGERELLARIMDLQKFLPEKYHKRRFDRQKSLEKTGTVAFEHETSPDRKPIATTSIQISGPGNKFTQANAHGIQLNNVNLQNHLEVPVESFNLQSVPASQREMPRHQISVRLNSIAVQTENDQTPLNEEEESQLFDLPKIRLGESVMTFAEMPHHSTDKPRLSINRRSIGAKIDVSNFDRALQSDTFNNFNYEDDFKKRFTHIAQNEKFLRRVNFGKDLIQNILVYMNEITEQFTLQFQQLLNMDQYEGDENGNPRRVIPGQEIQVSQNVPKTDKKNKILKARPRSQVLDSAKLIHPNHENFNLVCNIMMGIKKAIDSSLDNPLYEITEKEYNIKCQYEIAPYRTNQRDNIKACTFFDYAPQIFASIRKTYGIKKDTYSNSLGPDNILGYMFNANFQPLAELCSSGKSGSFFYYTSDGKFVLKTISRTEFKFIKRILKQYHQYLTNENPESLVSKVYGLHKIIFYRKKTANIQKKVYFAIMNNVFHTHMKIDKRYDLKGSTQGRQTILSEDQSNDQTIALKDLDFLKSKEKFKIEGDLKRKLLDTIKKDTQFFAKCDIIDYSLLVGVHQKNLHNAQTNNSVYLNTEQSLDNQNQYNSPIPSANQHFLSTYERNSNTSLMAPNQIPINELCERGIQSIEKSCVYFIGIIDILTEYNTKKKFEHVFKSIKYDSTTISCVPPVQYSERFDNFMKDAFQ